MNKQLIPRMVAMGNEVFAKGDLIYFSDINQYEIADDDYTYITGAQSHQLILCDDSAPIDMDDYDTPYFANGVIYYRHESELDVKKCVVIASHPQIPNTLPISPDTLRQIAEAGGECRVELDMEEYMESGHGGEFPAMRYPTDPSGCIVAEVVRNEAVDKPKITFDTGALREPVTVGQWTDEDMLAAWFAAANNTLDNRNPPYKEWMELYKLYKKSN